MQSCTPLPALLGWALAAAPPAAIGEGTRGRSLRGARASVRRLPAALQQQVDGWAVLEIGRGRLASPASPAGVCQRSCLNVLLLAVNLETTAESQPLQLPLRAPLPSKRIPFMEIDG